MKKARVWLSLLLFLSCCLTLPSCAILADLADTIGDAFRDAVDDADSAEYDEDDTSYGYYYDQLPENAKTVYRAVYKNRTSTEEICIVFREPLTVRAEAGEKDDSEAQISALVSSYVQPAMDALSYDHPEIDWIRMGKDTGSSSTFRIPSTRTLDGTEIVRTVRMLGFKIALTDLFPTPEERDAHVTAMQAALDAVTVTGDSRYELLSSIHDTLCEMTAYDAEGLDTHNAAGALLDGHAVCDGYARAFKLLCDKYGIPCVVVAGTAIRSEEAEPHAWNLVQMENGAWYAVDVTWDDKDVGHSLTYFLVGKKTLGTNGIFSETHFSDGCFSQGDYTPFTYPAQASLRYDPIWG